MAQPVIVDFILRGMPEVSRAFRTVEQAAAAAGRSQTNTAQRGARERISLAEREAREKVAAMRKADAATRTAQDRATREVERSARQRAKAEEKAERDAVRAAERSAADRIRIQQRVDREFQAMQRRQQAERDRVIREDDRREERAAQNRMRIRERSATMAGRMAARDANREEHERASFRRGIGQGVVSGVGKAGSAVVGGAKALGGLVSQLGGGFSVADSIARQGQLQRAAIALSNSAYIPGAEGMSGQRLDPKDIIARAKGASVATGMEASDLVEATKAYVAKSSDVKGGMANMEFFGQIAKATDTSVQDVAKTAGILRVQNKNLDEKAMKQMLLDVIMQGKQGSVEFEDLGRVAGKVTRSSANYGGTQADNQRKLLGLSQIAMRTAGSPEEAATILSNISADAMKHSKGVEKVLGKDTFDAQGRIAKGPDEFVADIMEKTGGNLMKIQGMGFGARSMKMFQALAPTFNEASEAAGGGKAGSAAGRKAIAADMGQVIGAKYSQANLEDDLKRVLAGGSEQFERAMRELRTAVGEQLAPEVIKLVPVLREAIPTVQRLLSSFVSMAEWASTNPIKAMFAIMTASIAKETAAAGLGQAIAKGLETSLGQKAGLTLGTATLAITTATIAVETIAQKHSQQTTKEIAASNVAFSDAAAVRVGDRTSKDAVAELVAERDRIASQVQKQREGVNSMEAIEYVGMLGKAASYTPVGYAARKLSGEGEGVFGDMDQSAAYQKAREDRLKQGEQALEQMNRAIVVATANLEKMGKIPPPGGGGGGGGTPPAGAAASAGIVQRSK